MGERRRTVSRNAAAIAIALVLPAPVVTSCGFIKAGGDDFVRNGGGITHGGDKPGWRLPPLKPPRGGGGGQAIDRACDEIDEIDCPFVEDGDRGRSSLR